MNKFEKNMTNVKMPEKENPGNKKKPDGAKERPANNLVFRGIEGVVDPGNKLISKKDGKIYIFSRKIINAKTGGEEAVLIPAQDDVENKGTVREVKLTKNVPIGEFAGQFERTGGKIFLAVKSFEITGNEFRGAEKYKGETAKIIITDKNGKVRIESDKSGIDMVISSDNLPADVAVQENEHVIYQDERGNIKSGKVVGYDKGELILGFEAGASGDETMERPRVKFINIKGKAKTAGDAQKKLEIFKKENDTQAVEKLAKEIEEEEEEEIGFEDVQELSQKISAIINNLKPKIEKHEYEAMVAEYNRAISQDHNYGESYKLLKELERKLSDY